MTIVNAVDGVVALPQHSEHVGERNLAALAEAEERRLKAELRVRGRSNARVSEAAGRERESERARRRECEKARRRERKE